MLFNSYLLKYGKSTIGFSVILFLCGHFLFLNKLKVVAIVFLYFCYYFFRIPKISITPNNMFVRGTCYGKVLKVQPITIARKKFIQVATFISLVDPHIQYAPVNGFLNKMVYKEGEFNSAMLFKKSNLNERQMYYVNSKFGPVIFSQIAGLLARTIIPFVRPKQQLVQGQEIGLIKFGSRSDIFIPYTENMQLFVKVGDKIKGPNSVLARYFTN